MKPQFIQCLLDILRADSTDSGLSQLEALSADDWPLLVDEVVHFRLAYQLQSAVSANGQRLESSIPAACRNRLAEAVRETLLHNLGQQHLLHKVLAACQDAAVPVLLLKGLWLTEVIYDDLKARNSGDIDLMLHPEDMPKFLQIARSLDLSIPVSEADMGGVMRGQNEMVLYAGHKASFDIHWSFTRPGEEKPIDEARLWQRAEYFKVAGLSCLSLCLEDHLLYLCFHTALHHCFLYVGPRALLDVAKLIEHPPRTIDWDYFVNSAQALGWQRGAGLTLELVRVHLGGSPPLAVMQSLNPAGIPAAVVDAALMAVFSGQDIHDSLTPNLVRMLDESSWYKKLQVLLSRVCPAPEVIESTFRQYHADASIYSLYVKHWRRLCRDHAVKLTSLLLGDRSQNAELNGAKLLRSWMEL